MASAAIDSAWTTALFRPTTRLRDLVREFDNDVSYELPYGVTEVELLPDLSPKHVLATVIMWEDFCRFLNDNDKFVWMGPGVCIRRAGFSAPPGYRLVLGLGPLNR
jgi:hypothetical protein